MDGGSHVFLGNLFSAFKKEKVRIITHCIFTNDYYCWPYFLIACLPFRNNVGS